ncbi:uncharacterized protein Tco025E_06853 [Trypanosoma conorhini]|uniref:Uncharacterized protein n=1 Tax=Trypanosoma conorhini TaxID=83891 RepID=A0A422NX13_9TRYP|nr:uncharacterized protein Tco025E_06853 [Trypanosoma conorhini]RNF10018.1 hypothetical protein Tco025E_06853 [Trypanosoma conorhini]
MPPPLLPPPPPPPAPPVARSVDDGGAWASRLLGQPVAAACADGCGASAALHPRQCCYAEGLLRRIIELERENDVLRVALLEGSERRLRQRFRAGPGPDSGFAPDTQFSAKQQQQRLLQRVQEIERNAKRCFQEELEKLQKQHTAEATAAAAAQSGTRGASYESTLAQSERRRWKEHVRHTVEELALLHREKEQQAAGVAAASVTATAEGSRCRRARAEGCGGDDSRIAALQAEVEHWKCEAEAARAGARLFQEQALKELQHMQAVYQQALGEGQSASAGPDAAPVAAALPTASRPAPARTRAEEDDGKGGAEGTRSATRDSPRRASFSLSHATPRDPVGGGSAAALDLLDAALGPAGAKPQEGARRRSYHSDVYLRQDSSASDERVPDTF